MCNILCINHCSTFLSEIKSPLNDSKGGSLMDIKMNVCNTMFFLNIVNGYFSIIVGLTMYLI